MIHSNITTKERQAIERDSFLRALVGQLPNLMAQAQARSVGTPPPAPRSTDFDETGQPCRYLRFGDKIGDHPVRPLRSTE